MNDTSRPASASPTISLIDREAAFSGAFRTPGDVRIEGRYDGEIECRGTVYIGETATVNARVTAGGIIIAGQFEGEVLCEGRFEILPAGRVAASVSTSVTVVHEGAFYQGELRMVAPGTRPVPATPSERERGGMTGPASPGTTSAMRSTPTARPAAGSGESASATAGGATPPRRRPNDERTSSTGDGTPEAQNGAARSATNGTARAATGPTVPVAGPSTGAPPRESEG